MDKNNKQDITPYIKYLIHRYVYASLDDYSLIIGQYYAKNFKETNLFMRSFWLIFSVCVTACVIWLTVGISAWWFNSIINPNPTRWSDAYALPIAIIGLVFGFAHFQSNVRWMIKNFFTPRINH